MVIICTHCGKEEDLHWVEETNARLARFHRCFICDYWIELSLKDKEVYADTHLVTGQWVHYTIHPDGSGGPKGFGGRPWLVTWFDEDREATTTRNLWHQGEVPERHRHRFTPNGELSQISWRLDVNGVLLKEGE